MTKGQAVRRNLEEQGIFALSEGKNTLREEVSDAYKDIDQVAEVVDGSGLSKRVVRLRPIGVIKG